MARIQSVDLQRPSPELVTDVAKLLRKGGVAAFPTDTTYGLGCSGLSREGLRRLRVLKRSSREAPFILLIGEAGWVSDLATKVTPLAKKLMSRYWPGPLSIVLEAAEGVPDEVTCGGGTVALRLPDCAWCVSLCRELGGPVASTSANLAGGTPAAGADEINQILGGTLDLILDGGAAREVRPSTIVDARGSKPVVLRDGVLSLSRSTAKGGSKGGGPDGGT